ncbi:MAG: M13 family metallopeptidase [Kofleriaceae bacterium]
MSASEPTRARAIAPSLLLAVAAACGSSGTTPATTTPAAGPATPTAKPVDRPPQASALDPAMTSPGPTAAPTTPVAPAQTITLADAGLEAASLDRKADPCVDFFQFACGGWLATHPIPDDKSSWGRFGALDAANEDVLRKILEEAAAGTLGKDEVSTKIGGYYGSCMNEGAIEKQGTKPIKSLLAKVGKVSSAKAWQAAVVELHKLGVPAVWATFAEADFADSTQNIVWLESGGLGLPDRDYYSDAKFADKVEVYRAHVARMFELLGRKPAAAKTAAEQVLQIETALAAVTKTGVEARDIGAMYNPTEPAALKDVSKSIDWKGYWKALGVNPGAKVNVASPKFFAAIDGLRKTIKPAAWASYFTYHLISESAFSVGKKYDDEVFALQQALSGVKTQRDRYKRCVDATTYAMPEYVGQPFVARAFPGTSKQAATDQIAAIADAMNAAIGKLDWMSPATQAAAREKLAKLDRMIGFPDAWKTYGFAVKSTDFAGNVLRARAAETKRQLQKAGKPVDRNEWLMGAYEVNAYYNPTTNNTALPAGILQPPFFGLDRSVAANMGGVGMVIGHELTHGFDDQGAQFDAAGNMKDWWQTVDKERFAAKGKCVSKQYSTFEALPGQFINGDLTLGENIADLGGVKMAFNAYRTLRAGKPPTVADGFTEDQQFFLGVGQAWCNRYRKEEQQKRLTTDVHSPAKFRVYGALRNLPEFATAFQCAAGTPMNPTNRCAVW